MGDGPQRAGEAVADGQELRCRASSPAPGSWMTRSDWLALVPPPSSDHLSKPSLNAISFLHLGSPGSDPCSWSCLPQPPAPHPPTPPGLIGAAARPLTGCVHCCWVGRAGRATFCGHWQSLLKGPYLAPVVTCSWTYEHDFFAPRVTMFILPPLSSAAALHNARHLLLAKRRDAAGRSPAETPRRVLGEGWPFHVNGKFYISVRSAAVLFKH